MFDLNKFKIRKLKNIKYQVFEAWYKTQYWGYKDAFLFKISEEEYVLVCAYKTEVVGSKSRPSLALVKRKYSEIVEQLYLTNKDREMAFSVEPNDIQKYCW